MQTLLAFTVSQYLRFYQKYAYDYWENLTPMRYGTILITVLVIGFFLLRSANR